MKCAREDDSVWEDYNTLQHCNLESQAEKCLRVWQKRSAVVCAHFPSLTRESPFLANETLLKNQISSMVLPLSRRPPRLRLFPFCRMRRRWRPWMSSPLIFPKWSFDRLWWLGRIAYLVSFFVVRSLVHECIIALHLWNNFPVVVVPLPLVPRGNVTFVFVLDLEIFFRFVQYIASRYIFQLNFYCTVRVFWHVERFIFLRIDHNIHGFQKSIW